MILGDRSISFKEIENRYDISRLIENDNKVSVGEYELQLRDNCKHISVEYKGSDAAKLRIDSSDKDLSQCAVMSKNIGTVVIDSDIDWVTALNCRRVGLRTSKGIDSIDLLGTNKVGTVLLRIENTTGYGIYKINLTRDSKVFTVEAICGHKKREYKLAWNVSEFSETARLRVIFLAGDIYLYSSSLPVEEGIDPEKYKDDKLIKFGDNYLANEKTNIDIDSYHTLCVSIVRN